MYILHLSDLLFGTKNNASRWYKQLTSDLYENFGCDCLDALIISGDVAKNSTPKEYEAAKEFIINLMIHFRLRWSEVVIVPGNHDLNWELSKEAFTPVRRKDDKGEERLVEDLDPEKYKQRFKYFQDFYESFFNETYSLDPEQQYTLHHFKNSGLLVLGLNSAWQLDHHYTSRAGINTDALGNAIRNINNNEKYKESRLKIAVWHHPLHGSSEDRIKDWGFMEQLVQNGFRLILHGHIHQASPDDFHHCEPAWGQIETIAAGTFGAPVRRLVPNYPLEYHLLNWKAKRLKVCSSKRIKPDKPWQLNPIFQESHCYEIEKVIPKQKPQPSGAYKQHLKKLSKAITRGLIVPFIGADINLCDRPRKDTDPSEWKEGDNYPPTIKELAAYVDRETGNNLGEEYLYHQKVISLLISSNLWGEMPKALNHENLINIACLTNLELQRVSQYYHQHGAEKFQDSINHIYDRAYTANSLHGFIVHLIKNVCPIEESVRGLDATRYPLIVTTCFDRTLEGSFEKEKLPFDLVSYTSSEKQFVYQKFELQNEQIICTEEAPITPENKDKKEFTSLLQERPTILRIYGPVKWNNTQNGENFAISEDHFLDYLAIDIPYQLPIKLWNKLLNGRLWFLGYDLSYWYLRFIIRKLRQAKRQAKTDISQWWAVQEKEGILDRHLWEKNGGSFIGGREIGSFEEYLRDVKAEVEEYQQNELDQLPTRPNRR